MQFCLPSHLLLASLAKVPSGHDEAGTHDAPVRYKLDEQPVQDVALPEHFAQPEQTKSIIHCQSHYKCSLPTVTLVVSIIGEGPIRA